jgi:hypothetical protein
MAGATRLALAKLGELDLIRALGCWTGGRGLEVGVEDVELLGKVETDNIEVEVIDGEQVEEFKLDIEPDVVVEEDDVEVVEVLAEVKLE